MTDDPIENPGFPSTESQAVYHRLKTLFGDRKTQHPGRSRRKPKKATESNPFGQGREPQGINTVIDSLTTDLGWTSSLAKSDLLLAWKKIAGSETAEHSRPIEVTDSVLTVRCDSTAWATQLRHMRPIIVNRISEEFPEAGISSVRFLAPDAPSWKKGSRSIPGRGPRDTYG